MKTTSNRYRPLAKLLTALFAVFLSINFAEAAYDGILWQKSSEWALVSPNYETDNVADAKQITDFTLPDRYGNPVNLSDFAPADVLIVNLWSSGCPPCKREIPSLSELDRRLPSLGKIVLLTITSDEKWEDVESYFPHGTDLRVLFDPEGQVIETLFGTEKFPETFILDKTRHVRARFDGERNWHSEIMMKYLASFLDS